MYSPRGISTEAALAYHLQRFYEWIYDFICSLYVTKNAGCPELCNETQKVLIVADTCSFNYSWLSNEINLSTSYTHTKTLR